LKKLDLWVPPMMKLRCPKGGNWETILEHEDEEANSYVFEYS